MTGKQNDTDGEDAYEVGYGRPPLGSRFTSERQPKNRGRKRGSRGIKTVLNEFISTPYSYTRNGVRTKGEPLDIMLRLLFASGIQHPKSGFQFYELVRSVLGDDDLGGPRNPLSTADKALLAEYVGNVLADADAVGVAIAQADVDGEDGDPDLDEGDGEDGHLVRGGDDVD